MATCQKCGKKGIFLKLDNGLCKECSEKRRNEEETLRKTEAEKMRQAEIARQNIISEAVSLYRGFSKLSSDDFKEKIKISHQLLKLLSPYQQDDVFNMSVINYVTSNTTRSYHWYFLPPFSINCEYSTNEPIKADYVSHAIKEIKNELQALERKKKNLDAFITLKNELQNYPIEISSDPIERRYTSDMPEIKFARLTTRTNKESLCNYVVIDIETTGLKTRGNEIIEIAAVRFEDFEPIEVFNTLVKPKKPIPEEATKINGITDDMVKDAPSIHMVIPSLLKFIGAAPIVGHNVGFDIKFLFCFGLDIFVKKRKYFDTVEICKSRLSDDLVNYKLDTICQYANVIRPAAHRAIDDAIACGLIFQAIVNEICEK